MINREYQITDNDSKLDLKNPDFHCQDRSFINETYASLAAKDGLHFNTESGDQGFWSITRYEDVLFVLQNPKIFSACHHKGGMRIFDVNKEKSYSAPHILSSDPPDHTLLRSAFNPLFSGKLFRELEREILVKTKEIITHLKQLNSFDFVNQISIPVSSVVMAKIIGCSEDECEYLVKLSDALISEDDTNHISRHQASETLVKIFLDLSKRELKPNTLPKLLLDNLGSKISEESINSNFRAFLIASNETTRHALSQCVISLSQFSDQKKALADDLSLIDSAVSELLRWTSPLLHVRRTAVHDTRIGRNFIKKGDKVVVWYQAANSDDSIWANAMELKLDRYKNFANRHLAFGAGIHRCPGRRLAELQLKVVLKELVSSFPNFSLAKKPIYLRSNFISGVKELFLNLN
jgi:linalool 8-monooxygenase